MVAQTSMHSDYEHFGFSMSHGPLTPMSRPHHHNELEIILIEPGGGVTWLFGGRPVMVSDEVLSVRWATVPHRIVRVVEGSTCYSLKIPFRWLLDWQLPETFMQPLLRGHMLVDRKRDHPCSDLALMRQWQQDLQEPTAELQRIVLHEVEARLRRVALSMALQEPEPTQESADPKVFTSAKMERIVRMAGFVAEHCAEPLCLSDIGRAVGLNPAYATHLFKKTFGESLFEYLTEQRVLHAQRLLATSDLKILDVALESGFGSASRFYAAFSKACGQTPRAYRMSLSAHGRADG